MTTMAHYILKGHRAVPVDLDTFLGWWNVADRVVQQEELPNGLYISTVFLGINHSFAVNAKPILFETMVFKSKDDFGSIDTERYHLWHEAAHGHKRIVKRYLEWKEASQE